MIYNEQTISMYRNAIIRAMPITEEDLTTKVATLQGMHIVTQKRVIAKVLNVSFGLSNELISKIMNSTNSAPGYLLRMANADINIGTIQQRDLDNFKSRLIRELK